MSSPAQRPTVLVRHEVDQYDILALFLQQVPDPESRGWRFALWIVEPPTKTQNLEVVEELKFLPLPFFPNEIAALVILSAIEILEAWDVLEGFPVDSLVQKHKFVVVWVKVWDWTCAWYVG